mmetsp:Transcript_14530/g.41480  ORF Transcript_14530/g.41480 Transcript_14530/m.41480 type:complete len:246 (+) Transcript_14530:934-1671(+)
MFPKAIDAEAAAHRTLHVVEMATPPPIADPVTAMVDGTLSSRRRAQQITPEVTVVVRGVCPAEKIGWWLPPGQRWGPAPCMTRPMGCSTDRRDLWLHCTAASRAYSKSVAKFWSIMLNVATLLSSMRTNDGVVSVTRHRIFDSETGSGPYKPKWLCQLCASCHVSAQGRLTWWKFFENAQCSRLMKRKPMTFLADFGGLFFSTISLPPPPPSALGHTFCWRNLCSSLLRCLVSISSWIMRLYAST